MTNVKKLSEIKAVPVVRNSTWIPSLDAIYGTSKSLTSNIGMPKGKISLWAGESGVGKSRLCIEVAKRFSTRYENGVVLYIQTESPLEDFAGWAKDTTQYNNIYCTGADRVDEIVDIIYQVRPKLIIIDSVNEIEDFTGNAKTSDRLIKGCGSKVGLKQATNDVGAHTILLGQLNQDGKTIKGGTALPHLVDVALNIVLVDPVAGTFKVEVGTKNRYGKRDSVANFKHTDEGVVEDLLVTDTYIGPYIDENGNSTDTISPAMQKRMDTQNPNYENMGERNDKPKGWYDRVGIVLDKIINH